jgi:UDPglucose 6-dehydrogenase
LQRFYEKMESELWVLNDKTIAIWGLAFKPNTDDLREAPALRLIELLKKAGAKLRVHDPVAMPNTRKVHPDLYYARDAIDACTGADALAVCTEWPQYRELDLAKVKASLRVPIVFDGRNCLDRKRAAELNIRLLGIGKEPIGAQ